MMSRDEGGRHTPVFDQYRPTFRSDTTDLGVAVVTLPADNPMLVPGTEVDVELEPVLLDAWSAITPGTTLGVFEKDQQVGTATVLPQ